MKNGGVSLMMILSFSLTCIVQPVLGFLRHISTILEEKNCKFLFILYLTFLYFYSSISFIFMCQFLIPVSEQTYSITPKLEVISCLSTIAIQVNYCLELPTSSSMKFLAIQCTIQTKHSLLPKHKIQEQFCARKSIYLTIME